MRQVVRVQPLQDTNLELTFDNGQVRIVDIKAIVDFDGMFASLNDPNFFRQVKLNSELGTIAWPNGADLCPDVLYESGAESSLNPEPQTLNP